MERLRKAEGFTLIELLVVVAIIAILAAIAIPQYAKYRERAAKASAISDAKNIATILEAYYADKQSYPDTITLSNNAHVVALDDGQTFTLSANNSIMNYDLIGDTAYTYSISNTVYGKYVSYDSSTGGVIENTW